MTDMSEEIWKIPTPEAHEKEKVSPEIIIEEGSGSSEQTENEVVRRFVNFQLASTLQNNITDIVREKSNTPVIQSPESLRSKIKGGIKNPGLRSPLEPSPIYADKQSVPGVSAAPRLKLTNARRAACPYQAAPSRPQPSIAVVPVPATPGTAVLLRKDKEKDKRLGETNATPSCAASGKASKARRARTRVGCVWAPPGAGERVRRRAWPARGMHERPEWPRAGEARSPSPMAGVSHPQRLAAASALAADTATTAGVVVAAAGAGAASAAASATSPLCMDMGTGPAAHSPALLHGLRRSMQMALHAALAYGAEVLQDLKEEFESGSHINSTLNGKNIFIPHITDQYCTGQFQNILDLQNQSQHLDLSQNSDGQSSSSTQMSDKDSSSEPLDLSEESMESDSYEPKDLPQSRYLSEVSNSSRLVNEEKANLNSYTYNKNSQIGNGGMLQVHSVKSLLDQPSTSSWLSNNNSHTRCSHKNERSPQLLIKKNRGDNENNIYLVTGHFDESNTFCITSSTEYKDTKESKINSNSLNAVAKNEEEQCSEDSQEYKFSSPHDLLKLSNCPPVPNSNLGKMPINELRSTNQLTGNNLEMLKGNVTVQWMQEASRSSIEMRASENDQKCASTRPKLPIHSNTSVPIFVKTIPKSSIETKEMNSKVVIVPVAKPPSISTETNPRESSSILTNQTTQKRHVFFKETQYKSQFLKSNISINQSNSLKSLSKITDSFSTVVSQFQSNPKTLTHPLNNKLIMGKNKTNLSEKGESSSKTSLSFLSLSEQAESRFKRNADINGIEGQKERKLPCTTLLLQESDNLLHIYSVKNSEDEFSGNTKSRELVLGPEKYQNNFMTVGSSDSLLMDKKLNSSSQLREMIWARSPTKTNPKCRISEQTTIFENANLPQEDINDSDGNKCGVSKHNEEHVTETSQHNVNTDVAEDVSVSEEKRVSTAIDSLVPFVLQRAIHYCMICDVAPEDLLTYLDSLSPASIPDWLE